MTLPAIVEDVVRDDGTLSLKNTVYEELKAEHEDKSRNVFVQLPGYHANMEANRVAEWYLCGNIGLNIVNVSRMSVF